jgi:hypothetical protein
MKNKMLALLVILVTVAVTSCSSSRKSGCPMNQQATYKFRA